MKHQGLFIAAGLAICLTGGCNDDSGAGASSPLCGNGITEQGEECDQGPANSDSTPGACRSDCSRPTCGDHVTDPWEDCDGEVGSEDCASLGLGSGSLGCTDRCRYDTSACEISGKCGNGVVDPGEECDRGPDNSDAYDSDCTTACKKPVCGDGILQAGEYCDHGQMNSDSEPDACRTDCSGPRCGDGVADMGEECDPGPEGEADGCTADCRATSFAIQGGGQDSSLAMAPDGRFLVVWKASTPPALGIFYSNRGLPDTDPFPIFAQQEGPVTGLSAGMADDGSFVVAACVEHIHGFEDSDFNLIVQRYDASGNALGDEITFGSGHIRPRHDVGMAADGSFIAFWDSIAQRYDSLGNPVGPQIPVGPFRSTSVGRDGHFAVAYRDGTSRGVVRNYDSTGQLTAEITTDGQVDDIVVDAGPGDGFSLVSTKNGALDLYSYDGMGNERSHGSLFPGVAVERTNLAKAAQGGFLLSWVLNTGELMTPKYEMQAVRLNEEGQIVTPILQINDNGLIDLPARRFLATDDAGRSVFLYISHSMGARGRLYDERSLPRGPGAW